MVIKRLMKLIRGEEKKSPPKNEAPKGAEKRLFIRIEYPPQKRPIFKTKNHNMEVINISERGLKIVKDKPIEMDKWVRGQVAFSSGKYKSIEVSGQTVWQKNNEVGLLLNGNIPQHIMKEQGQLFSKK